MTDLALNQRLGQGTFFGVVGGLDFLVLPEGPHPTFHLLGQLTGAHCAGPMRSLSILVAKLSKPRATWSQMPGESAGSFAARRAHQCFPSCIGDKGEIAVLQAQQLFAEFSSGARAFGDGR